MHLSFRHTHIHTHTHTPYSFPSCLHLRGWNRRKDQGPGLDLRKTVQREVEDITANTIHLPTCRRACPAVGTGHFLLYNVREPGLLCSRGLRPGGLDVEPDRVGGGKGGGDKHGCHKTLGQGTSPQLVHNPPTKGNGLAAHFQSV